MLNRKRELIWAATALILCAAIITGIHLTRTTPKERHFSRMSSRVTPSQCEQIKLDMTYDEVVSILGEDGFQTTKVQYAWPGEYYSKFKRLNAAKPELVLSFEENKVTRIHEVNIMDGAEIYDNLKNKKEAVTELSVYDVRHTPNRTSYKSVVEKLGSEGILVSSNDNNRTYRWKSHREENGKNKDVYVDMLFTDGEYTPLYYKE